MNRERAPIQESKHNPPPVNPEKLAEMLVTLQRFGHPLESESIDTHRAEVTRMTDEMLISTLNASEDSDWRTRPLFYEAVYEELERRGLLPHNSDLT